MTDWESQFNDLVESLCGALRLSGEETEDAHNHPMVNLPAYANEIANRLAALSLSREEQGSLRFCVETADRCLTTHAANLYPASVGHLARAFDVLARAAATLPEGDRHE